MFPGSPERAAVNIVSGSDTMPTVGPLRSLRRGPPASVGLLHPLPRKKPRKKNKTMRGKERERGGEGNEEAWRNKHRRRPREAEMMKVKKLGSLCWSATCRLKEQIRETAHPRTLTQPHSKSSSVPLAQRKPEPAKQTNRRASAAKRYYNSKPAAF